jgi:hypothetical protein
MKVKKVYGGYVECEINSEREVVSYLLLPWVSLEEVQDYYQTVRKGQDEAESTLLAVSGKAFSH